MVPDLQKNNLIYEVGSYLPNCKKQPCCSVNEAKWCRPHHVWIWSLTSLQNEYISKIQTKVTIVIKHLYIDLQIPKNSLRHM